MHAIVDAVFTHEIVSLSALLSACLAHMSRSGWWHSHHNESDEDAWVLPMQDAGLHTHLRTLNIRFVVPPSKPGDPAVVSVHADGSK